MLSRAARGTRCGRGWLLWWLAGRPALCLALVGGLGGNAGAWGLAAPGAAPAAAPLPSGFPGLSVPRSAPAVVAVFPADGATAVCPDAPLRIRFSSPPTLGKGGKIRIADAASGAVVETIDVSSTTATKSIGGLGGFTYFPVIVSDREAAIYPRNGVLAYGKTYLVTVEPGVFDDGGPARGAPSLAWRFTTRAASPARGAARLTVAADGSADFCTVQGALDFIPAGNTTPTTIFLRKGTYTEIVFFTDKHAVTLIGEDRKQTVLTYANNDRFNHSPGNPYAPDVRDPRSAKTAAPVATPATAPVTGPVTRPVTGPFTRPVTRPFVPNPSDVEVSRGDSIYRRAVFLAHRANDLTLANLTIRNTTPARGSQAETIILNGTSQARAILKDLDLDSTQDTLQINGQAYVVNCNIDGDVDFIWGRGPCFFESCVFRALRSNGFYTQIRNPDTNHGFVFVRCRFDGVSGSTGNYLSRIKTARFPDSEVVLIDCVLGAAVDPVAWQLQDDAPGGAGGSGSGIAAERAGDARLHFWEWNSRDPAGKPAPVGARLPASRQLTRPRDAAVITSYVDPTFVLGNGWKPTTAEIFRSRR